MQKKIWTQIPVLHQMHQRCWRHPEGAGATPEMLALPRRSWRYSGKVLVPPDKVCVAILTLMFFIMVILKTAVQAISTLQKLFIHELNLAGMISRPTI